MATAFDGARCGDAPACHTALAGWKCTQKDMELMIINAMLTYLHISIPTYLSGNAIPGRRSGKYHWYTMTSRHGKTSMRMSSRSFDKAGGQVSRLHHCMYRDLFSHYIHTYSHDPIVSTLSTQRLQFSGCLDAANSNILEAPLYNNRQIEDAWLFLLEMRRRHKNRGKHVQECARVLGAFLQLVHCASGFQESPGGIE